MSNPYIGEIRMFGGDFAPVGWAFCNGQVMAISGNEALFNLIGTTYGGDGQSTFALPNLQSQLPIHQGQGPGLSPYVIGQTAGTSTVTLSSPQIPSHSHTLNVSTASATSATVAGNVPAQPSASGAALYATPGNPTPIAQSLAGLQFGGGSQPHSNLMPSLCVSFIISLFGIFPSQN